MNVMADADLPLEPSDLQAMWDFGDPSASAARFVALLDRIDPGSIQANDLTTQHARAYGLMGSFADGHRLPIGLAIVIRVVGPISSTSISSR